MKKLLIVVLMLAFVIACGAEQKKSEPAKQVKKADVAKSLSEKMTKFFAEKNMKGIDVSIKEVAPVKEMPGLTFVKLIITDTKSGKSQIQHAFANDSFLVPNVIDVAKNQPLLDLYEFKYTDGEDIDVSDLSILKGKKGAKNTIVMVSDFQCPYCRTAKAYIYKKLEESGKDVVVYMLHMPLPFHKQAVLYAKIFEAGLMMGKNFSDELMATQPGFDKKKEAEIVKHFADKTGDAKKFGELLNSKEIINKINAQIQTSQKLGIRGTPHVFFNGKAVGGYKTHLYDIAIGTFK